VTSSVIVRDVERGENIPIVVVHSTRSCGENNNNLSSPFMKSTCNNPAIGKNKVTEMQEWINLLHQRVTKTHPQISTSAPEVQMRGSESSISISESQSTNQPKKRVTGWGRLKAGPQDQVSHPSPVQEPKQESFGDSLQCNLDRLSSKDSSDSMKPRIALKPCDRPEFDLNDSFAEMVESLKVTQKETQNLSERVAKMEEMISDFVQKLNVVLPILAAGIEDDRHHHCKRSKSKARPHHRSSSSQAGSGTSPGAQNNPSHPTTPNNPPNLKWAIYKNEEFL
jgi:hypothetical protein